MDKCPVTGLPVQSLYTPEEIAEFETLDAQFINWLAWDDDVSDERRLLALAHYGKGEYDKVVVVITEEFVDTEIDTKVTVDDMKAMMTWYKCIMSGFNAAQPA